MMFRMPAVAALALVAATTASSAQDRTFGLWRESCDGGVCQVYFNMQHPDGDALAIGLGLLYDPGRSSYTLVLRAPEMTALPPGLTVALDPEADPETVPFQFCGIGSCTGFLVLDAAQFETLEAASSIRIGYIPYGTAGRTAFEVPVTGVTDAAAALAE